jgi:SAM-dependent methyltransferase
MTATAQVGMVGAPPRLEIGKGNPEAVKYGKIWERPEYRITAPGEQYVPLFIQHAQPKIGSSIIDFGCGTGRGALAFHNAGFEVTAIDFVKNCLDDEPRKQLKFVKADLEQPISVYAEYGYCTDVMEHIPEVRVDMVLDNILNSAQHVFFAIAGFEDRCGELIGERLHLTVHNYGWWLAKFAQHECIIHWSQPANDYCFFYVTAWKTGRDVVKNGKLNIEEEQIRKNVAHNIKQDWLQVVPYEPNDLECVILGGGPSLNDYADEIKDLRDGGAKLLTMNGTYQWALDHGLTPSAQLVVDARAFNARFTKPVVDNCKYMISSQCDPSVFEGLPKDRTYIWHTNPEVIKDLVSDQYEAAYFIPGGSCILLRAVPLMRMLGYKKFHLFGCDSCLIDDKHHAYSQAENDGGRVMPVIVEGRTFLCHPWMISQAEEFMEMVRTMGDEVDLAVYGDGLLSHIINVSAEMEAKSNGSIRLENLSGS